MIIVKFLCILYISVFLVFQLFDFERKMVMRYRPLYSLGNSFCFPIYLFIYLFVVIVMITENRAVSNTAMD